MLSQQVGFVCAVLALVCCASRFFGSWGRYRRGPVPGVWGSWTRKQQGGSETSPLPSQSGWSPPYLSGRAHPGGLTSTR